MYSPSSKSVSSNRNDLKATNRLLKAKPHLVNTDVFMSTVRRPIHLAVTVGNLEIVNALLRHMSEEDVKAQDSSGPKISECLIGKNKELLTFPDNNGLIPIIFACNRAHKDMTHCLYNETTLAYLLSPENQTHAALVVGLCIRSKLFGKY
ncbi:uncharacterized protein LOC111297716 [Durio zibethinus]|uniref:Uncharacterized protein LOC111297716 n=1 Tax=Durio zibethinus TaxID=66656 RepID=A0A6P5Z686_DURZI|nr:uncharacterized protein LOC111297716 [Durio zibethinus]